MMDAEFRMVMRVALPAVALLMLLVSAAWAAPAAGLLPINPNNWAAVAFAGVLVVIAVAAFAYVLGGFTGSPSTRAWAQAQIYQAAVSLALLLIFAFFVYLLLLNPVPAFGAVGLVPGYVPPGTATTASSTMCGAMQSNTIFSLAACDMFTFNQNAFTEAETLFYLSYLTGITPGISITVTGCGAPKCIPPLQLSGVSTGTKLADFVPLVEENTMTTLFAGLFFALVLNQLQSLLVGGSLLWLSLFLTIGLVARCFGITRTFGGTMIALGLGLGLIYPILISIMYGYINVGVLMTGPVDLATNFSGAFALLLSSFGAVISGQVGVIALPLLDSPFVSQLAYAVAGLTFIPFLLFTILDAFIRDFSKVVGTEIDFMSLIGGLI